MLRIDTVTVSLHDPLDGPDEPAAPPHHSRLIHGRARPLRLVVVPDTAHVVNIKQAERVRKENLAHLTAPDIEATP